MVDDVDITWHFEDLGTALAATVERTITLCRLADAGYRLENRFRYLLALRD